LDFRTAIRRDAPRLVIIFSNSMAIWPKPPAGRLGCVSESTRLALITGGSRGIGAATATTMAAQGWDIVLSYRERSDAADSVVAAVEAMGRRALAVQADMASEADIVQLFETVDSFGRLDALINNAGIVSPAGRVDSYDLARLTRMFTINITAPFLCAREAVRRMSTGHGGSGGVIVNVSSRAATLGGAGEYVDYAASKGALDSMTIGLGKEVAAEGIRVVGVGPGLIDTEIHAPGRLDRIGSTPPMGRPGTAQEVADVIAFLASDAASYVTAATLEIAGAR
jgi:NAD(P)-dependent dehydrogenase (short-subunit alcohol dehydrogenase family)